MKDAQPHGTEGLKAILHGIEYFLLAPIPFIACHALAKYMRDYQNHGKTTEDSKRSLLHVKALIAGLISGAVAIDITGTLLGVSISDSDQLTTGFLQLIALKFLGLAILSAVFFCLEHLLAKPFK